MLAGAAAHSLTSGRPRSELTTSDQLPSAGQWRYRLYFLFATFFLPISRSVPVVSVVTWLTPARQIRSAGSWPRSWSSVRLLSDGRPYSTATGLPPIVVFAVSRGA